MGVFISDGWQAVVGKWPSASFFRPPCPVLSLPLSPYGARALWSAVLSVAASLHTPTTTHKMVYCRFCVMAMLFAGLLIVSLVVFSVLVERMNGVVRQSILQTGASMKLCEQLMDVLRDGREPPPPLPPHYFSDDDESSSSSSSEEERGAAAAEEGLYSFTSKPIGDQQQCTWVCVGDQCLFVCGDDDDEVGGGRSMEEEDEDEPLAGEELLAAAADEEVVVVEEALPPPVSNEDTVVGVAAAAAPKRRRAPRKPKAAAAAPMELQDKDDEVEVA